MLYKKNNIPTTKSEDRHIFKNMLLHYANNNILIHHLYSSGVYQYEYENLDHYQKINIFLSWNLDKTKCKTCGSHYSCKNQLIKESYYILEMGIDEVSLYFFPFNIHGEMSAASWGFNLFCED